MEQTLLLNASFEPLQVIPWQKAVTLLWQGKVEVVEFHDREVRGVSVTIRLPSVLRLLRFIRAKPGKAAGSPLTGKSLRPRPLPVPILRDPPFRRTT